MTTHIHFKRYFIERPINKEIQLSYEREQNGKMVTRIVKIGGASITDKSQFEHVKLENINFIVDLFKNNYKNLILIHGAGSFG